MTKRLEEIKHLVGYVNKAVEDDDGNNVITTLIELFSEGHIDWLIKQAKHVEELKEVLKKLSDTQDDVWDENIHLKQALEFYANPENHDREVDYGTDSGLAKSDVDIDRGRKARKALEGEE